MDGNPSSARRQLPDASLATLSEVPLRATVTDSADGARRYGRFIVLRAHAAGGLGQVSVALDESLGRVVALKQIRSDLTADAAARRRFLNEAEITGQLQHPGIVPLYLLGMDDAGRPYYAMKFVEGQTLDEAIAEYHAHSTPRALRDLLVRFVEVCNAIAYAHHEGVIHRDIKPANIMLGKFGETVILDWGLAQRIRLSVAAEGEVRGDRAMTPPSARGRPVGTPAFMPPEQAAGRADVGPASDVYGLGAVLYQLISGRAPYSGADSGEVVAQVMQGPPAAPSAGRRVSPALEAICLTAMSRDPRRRFNASELGQEVQRWLADEPLASYRGSALDSTMRWARRHRAMALAVASLLVVVSLGSAAATVLVTREKNATANALEDKAKALVGEAGQRRLAEQRERILGRRLYAANVRDAVEAWRDGHVTRAMNLLNAQRPLPGATDLRGFEWHYLWNQIIGAPLAVFDPPGGAGMALDLSPSGQMLAVASADHDVLVWDLNSGQVRFTMSGHTKPIVIVAFSPDSRVLVSAGGDGIARLWDAATGQSIQVLRAHVATVLDAAFSPDGSALVTCGDDGMLRTWQVRSGRMIAEFGAGKGVIRSCAFAPDGAGVVSGGVDGTVTWWDPRTGQELRRLSTPDPEITHVAFSPDGKQLATGSQAWVTRIWDVESARQVREYEQVGGTSWNAFSPDGQFYAAAATGGQIQVWERATGRKRLINGGEGGPAFAFSAAGHRLACVGPLARVNVWDLSVPETPATIGDPMQGASAIALNADGSLAIVGTSSGMIELWDTVSGRRTAQVPVGAAVECLALSRDGTTLAVGDSACCLSFWQVSPLRMSVRAQPQPHAITDVGISDDGTLAVTADAKDTVKTWDARTATQLASIPGAGQVVDLTGDGARVATGARFIPPAVWDVRSQRLLVRFPGEWHAVNALRFTPDGSALGVGSEGGNALLWNVRQAEPDVTHLQTERFTVSDLAFLPGNRLVTTNPYRTLQFWDVTSGEECASFEAELDMDKPSLAVSGDCTTLAAVTRDGLVRIWRTPPRADRPPE